MDRIMISPAYEVRRVFPDPVGALVPSKNLASCQIVDDEACGIDALFSFLEVNRPALTSFEVTMPTPTLEVVWGELVPDTGYPMFALEFRCGTLAAEVVFTGNADLEFHGGYSSPSSWYADDLGYVLDGGRIAVFSGLNEDQVMFVRPYDGVEVQIYKE